MGTSTLSTKERGKRAKPRNVERISRSLSRCHRVSWLLCAIVCQIAIVLVEDVVVGVALYVDLLDTIVEESA